MRLKLHNIIVLFIVLISSVVWGQNEKKKEEADKLFEKEEYVDATRMYLELLSLNPKDVDINFKYGACLLYNSSQKQEAIRYLKYAVDSENADVRAYYFLGKAYHLNYQFDDAKKYYLLYRQNSSKKDKRYPVDRNIEMCENGKNLLSTFTDIIVSQKQEIERDKFFRLYHDMQSIGGQILVTERFQSKLDRRKGHVPIVHFPKNAKAVYYSSYGNDDSNGLDIFVRKKLPNGEWGKEQRLPDDVNTPYDDNFPYLHPSGNYLYFSSKGHNSMGGYDVFLARKNQNSDRFERVENVDFAISSPDDDLFYVVDSLYQNAYFASSRQSKDGKVHVYRVKVARVPIEQVLIMGSFLSEINPENKKMSVSVFAVSNNKKIGTISSDFNGQFSFVFPKGGKYRYQIEIEGSDLITEVTIDLPFLDEFRMLKQHIIHTEEDGREIVKVVNLFDEKVEGGGELLASVIRKKANLDVNIDDFDPKALAAFELSAKRAEILEGIGYNGMSSREVLDQLNDLATNESTTNKRIHQIGQFLDLKIVSDGKRLEELIEQHQLLMDKVASSTSDAQKFSLFSEAKKIEDQINQLSIEVSAIESIKEEVDQLGVSESASISFVRDEFKKLIDAGKEEEALDLLASEHEKIKRSQSLSVEDLSSERIDERIQVNKDVNRLKDQLIEYEREIKRLTAEIQVLDSKLVNARKREVDDIQREIQSKESELSLYKEEQKRTQEDIRQLNRNEAKLSNEVDLLYEANNFSQTNQTLPEEEVQKAIHIGQEAEKLLESSELENQIAKLDLTGSSDVQEVDHINTQETIKSEVDKNEREIIANRELNEEEKLEALIENNERALENIDQSIQKIEEKASEVPNQTAYEHEIAALNELKQDIIDRTKSYQNSLKEVRDESDVALTKEEVIESLYPDYQTKRQEIERKDDLTGLESIEEIQQLDKTLLDYVTKRLVEIETKLSETGLTSKLTTEKSLLENVQQDLSHSIAQRETEIDQLKKEEDEASISNESGTTRTFSVVKEEFLSEIANNFSDKREQISKESDVLNKYKKSWEIEQEVLDYLKEERDQLEKNLSRDENNKNLQLEKEVLDELITQQNSVVQTKKEAAANEFIDSEEYTALMEKIDRNFTKKLNTTGVTSVSIEQEQKFQEKIKEQIDKNKSILERKYSVSVDLENMMLDQILRDSQERVSQTQSHLTAANSPEQKEQYLQSLREEILRDSAAEIDAEYSTKSELEEQEKLLKEYHKKIVDRLNEVQSERKIDSENVQIIAEESFLEEEISEVNNKLDRIRITIGELTTEVVTDNSDDELQQIIAEESRLSNALEKEDLTSFERKEIQEKLNEVQKQRLTHENEVTTEKIQEVQTENEKLAEVLVEKETTEGELSSKFMQSAKATTEEELAQVKKAKSEEEKAYLLEKIKSHQEQTSKLLTEIVVSQQIEYLEEKEDISIQSKNELESTKRKYSIQIGLLETRLESLKEELANAKRKDRPSIEKEIDQIESEITLLTQRVTKINDQLDKMVLPAPFISEQARNTEVSFNEERKLAATEEYKAYLEIAQDAIGIENEINQLRSVLEEEKTHIRLEIREDPTTIPSDIELRTNRITNLEAKINDLEIEKKRIVELAEKELPSDKTKAMKIQNLVARGIQPIKTTLVATALLQMPTNGFSIETKSKGIYSEENPIPVDVESPSGLVYRVQVGAFSRPIPQDLFNEFNPVSGEKIPNTNITRYMVGFFNSSESVTNARQKIRDLGYSDAFVVAYCNGERVTFSEARRLEAAGVCVPKGDNEIMIEVAEKTAKKLGIETVAEVIDVPDWSYHDAPGAVDAIPMESKQGLFFTVQIGVFNRPVSKEEVKNLPEIMTYRLSNGQIRYATGLFDSVEEALPRRREALDRGMKGSFITAYYQGKRISISDARALLAEKGTKILESNQNTKPEQPIETPENIVRTDSVDVETIEILRKEENQERPRVQIVSKKQYNTYPRDILNRYNTEGNFYFDLTDNRVKSIIYKNEDHLPRLSNFSQDIDTIFLSEADYQEKITNQILIVPINDTILPGDFMDWLIRLPYMKEIKPEKDAIYIYIREIEPNKIMAVQNNIRTFSLSSEIKDEVELEGRE